MKCNIFIKVISVEFEWTLEKRTRWIVIASCKKRVDVGDPSIKLVLLITERQDVNFSAFTEQFVQFCSCWTLINSRSPPSLLIYVGNLLFKSTIDSAKYSKYLFIAFLRHYFYLILLYPYLTLTFKTNCHYRALKTHVTDKLALLPPLWKEYVTS